MNEKTWIQAAIDVMDINTAKEIALMSLDAGAEWLEVGTPLLYKYGHSAIGQIRKTVGDNVVLVADYKTPLSVLCAKQAKEEGADYLLVYGGYNDYVNKWNIEYCKEIGITPIIDLQVRPDDMQVCIDRVFKFGASYFFTHHFNTYVDSSGKEIKVDALTDLHIPIEAKLGITNDDFNDAIYCAQNGADWIIFGYVLRNPNKDVCKKWVMSIHNTNEKRRIK